MDLPTLRLDVDADADRGADPLPDFAGCEDRPGEDPGVDGFPEPEGVAEPGVDFLPGMVLADPSSLSSSRSLLASSGVCVAASAGDQA